MEERGTGNSPITQNVLKGWIRPVALGGIDVVCVYVVPDIVIRRAVRSARQERRCLVPDTGHRACTERQQAVVRACVESVLPSVVELPLERIRRAELKRGGDAV